MDIKGQLRRAQLENLVADLSPGTAEGLIWWNTTDGQARIDDGALIRALLRNDQKIIIGNNGTAANNIRLHRGADGVLQFISAADTAAEGVLSTIINQISARQENYTTGGRPANGNAGRTIWNITTGQLNVDNGATWDALAAGSAPATEPSLLENMGIDCSVAANALTITLTQSDGATAPSVGSGTEVRIAFRDVTLEEGGYIVRTVSSTLSTVISSGSTGGTTSAAKEYIYLYAIDNAGTVELAWSLSFFDDGSVVSTTAEGGAGAADDSDTLYSTTARSNVSCRFLKKLESTQATAGTWAAVPTEIAERSTPRYTYGSTQVFTADDTWTRPQGCKAVEVEVISGGGGGGGADGIAARSGVGGGGGGGGASIKFIKLGLGATETITVGDGGAEGTAGGGTGGTGGASSFGSHCSATGGAGGVGDTVANAGAQTASQGGAGGVGSSGDSNITGIPGGASFTLGATSGVAGLGGRGAGPTGSGGGQTKFGNIDGTDGTAPGGGGSGGSTTGATDRPGGLGGDGIVIVKEYY